MPFDPNAYGPDVAAILMLDGCGERLMPLAGGQCSSPEARARISGGGAARLFPEASAPQAALAGLYVYFSCLDEAHTTAQEINSAEGSYWHAIVHRQEPDPTNAGYWFGRVGRHPIFPALMAAATDIAASHPGVWMSLPEAWDSKAFTDVCESARREPGGPLEALARQIQLAEWQLLFDYCARPGR